MSPERAGSPQEEKAMTPKMSVPGSPVAGTPVREAQSPFSCLLAAVQSQTNRSPDDDLTNLSWLQANDLLTKGMQFASPSPSSSTPVSPLKNHSIISDQSPTSDYVDDSSISAADSSSSSLNSPIPHQPTTHHQTGSTGGYPVSIRAQPLQRYRHPHTIPYDPMVHVTNKPPYSFSCLIFMAIEDSDQKALPVKEIYAWVIDHFPYFKTAPTGWKNSVRHNLSLNKCFQKVEKAPNLGKGSLWTVDQQYRPNLQQALTRSPYHPCSGLDPSDYNKTKPMERNASSRLPNPELFPYLSYLFDEVDAAAAMLTLSKPKYGKVQQVQSVHNLIITTSPSQDHTYSAADHVTAETDEAFESDEERPPTRRKIDFAYLENIEEDEEERKIKEGAETLLNLAGIDTRKRIIITDKYVVKRVKVNPGEKPFRPRLLRKKRDTRKLSINNSNNNNNNIQTDNEWTKQRREMDINLAR